MHHILLSGIAITSLHYFPYLDLIGSLETRLKRFYPLNMPGSSHVFLKRETLTPKSLRYPACPTCLTSPPILADGARALVEVDHDGAWSPTSNAGVLKPAVVMFGESIASDIKIASERAIDEASRVLVVGSSLATYSAWRLVKRAKERHLPIGILNLGGVRGEETFYADLETANEGELGIRCNESADQLLPKVVDELRASPHLWRKFA